MKKAVKIAVALIVVLIALYFLPLFVVEVQGSDGSVYNAPVLSSFVSDEDGTVTFSNIRSSYATQKDAENALHSYEESTCYGTTYYYDENNDVSYTDVESTGGTISYHYVNGNACSGWTTDDEIAWEFGAIEEMYFYISVEDAVASNYLVIVDGEVQNVGVYNDFANMAKQMVYSYMRTIVDEGDERTIIDIQLLESGKFRVITRTDNETSDAKEYDRFSEVEIDGHRTVCVFETSREDAEPIALFALD